MCEISFLMWEFGARYGDVDRSVNQAKASEEGAMSETPIRAWQVVSCIHGLWGMDIYKNKVLQFLHSERSDESVFGLWGTSGVGKTRLLSLIAASYADSFCHILFLDGGSSVTDMQHHLAYFLKLDWETMSSLEEHCRAKIIIDCLAQDSFLLLLDNVMDRPLPRLGSCWFADASWASSKSCSYIEEPDGVWTHGMHDIKHCGDEVPRGRRCLETFQVPYGSRNHRS